MRKFKGYVSIGLVGCKREVEFEVEDDATEDQIDETAHDEAMQMVDYWYEEV